MEVPAAPSSQEEIVVDNRGPTLNEQLSCALETKERRTETSHSDLEQLRDIAHDEPWRQCPIANYVQDRYRTFS